MQPRSCCHDSAGGEATIYMNSEKMLVNLFCARLRHSCAPYVIACKQLSAHYGFEPVFCNPASGNEKGLIENLVGYIRRNVCVPLPKVKSWRR